MAVRDEHRFARRSKDCFGGRMTGVTIAPDNIQLYEREIMGKAGGIPFAVAKMYYDLNVVFFLKNLSHITVMDAVAIRKNNDSQSFPSIYTR
jgi:hypothetical protein